MRRLAIVVALVATLAGAVVGYATASRAPLAPRVEPLDDLERAALDGLLVTRGELGALERAIVAGDLAAVSSRAPTVLRAATLHLAASERALLSTARARLRLRAGEDIRDADAVRGTWIIAPLPPPAPAPSAPPGPQVAARKD